MSHQVDLSLTHKHLCYMRFRAIRRRQASLIDQNGLEMRRREDDSSLATDAGVFHSHLSGPVPARNAGPIFLASKGQGDSKDG
jgi:hypothetical protein